MYILIDSRYAILLYVTTTIYIHTPNDTNAYMSFSNKKGYLPFLRDKKKAHIYIYKKPRCYM
jgi:hypothetical protein